MISCCDIRTKRKKRQKPLVAPSLLHVARRRGRHRVPRPSESYGVKTHRIRRFCAEPARVAVRVDARYAFEFARLTSQPPPVFDSREPFPRQSALTPTPACRFRTIPSLDVVFQPRETKDGFLGHLRETLRSLSLLNTDVVTSTRPRLCAIGLHFSPY